MNETFKKRSNQLGFCWISNQAEFQRTKQPWFICLNQLLKKSDQDRHPKIMILLDLYPALLVSAFPSFHVFILSQLQSFFWQPPSHVEILSKPCSSSLLSRAWGFGFGKPWSTEREEEEEHHVKLQKRSHMDAKHDLSTVTYQRFHFAGNGNTFKHPPSTSSTTSSASP